MKLILRQLRVAAAAGPQSARIQRFEMADVAGEKSVKFFAARLIAISHQGKTRMVAVGFQDARRFRVNPRIYRLAVAEGRALVRPRARFDLEIKTQFVRRRKCRFWRAPRMEPKQI